MVMLRSNKSKQSEIECVSVEDLVPEDPLLRRIDQYIDFSFILEKVRHLYSEDNGHPSIDPIVLFKMMFIGYLYGIRSERQLEKEIQVNVAYRWFLGLNLTDKVPDHTTISWNRRKRFKGTTVFQDIFDEIVLLAQSKRMVGGRMLFTDSTHLKANANKRTFIKQEVEASTKSYIDELDQAIEEDRRKHGKKPLKKKEIEVETKEIKERQHGLIVRVTSRTNQNLNVVQNVPFLINVPSLGTTKK